MVRIIHPLMKDFCFFLSCTTRVTHSRSSDTSIAFHGYCCENPRQSLLFSVSKTLRCHMLLSLLLALNYILASPRNFSSVPLSIIYVRLIRSRNPFTRLYLLTPENYCIICELTMNHTLLIHLNYHGCHCAFY